MSVTRGCSSHKELNVINQYVQLLFLTQKNPHTSYEYLCVYCNWVHAQCLLPTNDVSWSGVKYIHLWDVKYICYYFYLTYEAVHDISDNNSVSVGWCLASKISKKVANLYSFCASGFRFLFQAASVPSFHWFACLGFLSSQVLNRHQKTTQKSVNSVNPLKTSGFDICDSFLKSDDAELQFRTSALHILLFKNSLHFLNCTAINLPEVCTWYK